MTTPSAHGKTSDPIKAWQNPTIKVVDPTPNHHTIHSYFNTCPESPNGNWVLFYRSATPEAYTGELVIRNRQSNEERILAHDVTVEDAHRAACQQWSCNGKEVVFHDYRQGEWIVAAVHIDTLDESILAKDRQLCWGQSRSPIVPLYSPHSQPGHHHDLELLNVETGEIQTVLTASEVVKAYPDFVAKYYEDKPVSIFFPILSPDGNKVIFKLASPLGGNFRSKQASLRHFLIAYDLKQKKFLFLHEKWGHPAWHPDSTQLINIRSILIDITTGATTSLPGDIPFFPGTHPSISPDGQLFITDSRAEPFGGKKGEWAIVVGSLATGDFQLIHTFDQSQGATSWRVSHPHPAMSADGKRIYFNGSSNGWTRLYVLEQNK